MPSTVAIVRCEDYSQNAVDSAVQTAIRLAGLEPEFRSGASVLLKPNLLSARLPDDAVTTHPSIIRIAGRIAIESGCTVCVGDSPPFAGENESQYLRHCERCGVAEAARDLGIPLVRFEENVVKITCPSGRFYKSFEFARAVVDSDLIVNISKLKTHGLTGFSGAVKNIFGCVPGIRKGMFHVQAAEDLEVFGQMLVDLYAAIKPRINIMDAVVAMEGEGPNSGSPKHMGLILASNDAVALDAAACAIVGIEPVSIQTIRLAHEQGLGCGDISQIHIEGESIESASVPDFKQSSGKNDWVRIPAPIRQLLRKQLIAVPVIGNRECIGCNDCARVCPVKAISVGRPPKIDLDKCIRCYCCHEVCNSRAIHLRRGLLGRLASKFIEKNDLAVGPSQAQQR